LLPENGPWLADSARVVFQAGRYVGVLRAEGIFENCQRLLKKGFGLRARRSLLLQATSIKRLHGDGLTAEQDILLSEGFQAQGEVSLKNARIEGSIYFIVMTASSLTRREPRLTLRTPRRVQFF
jgi:hypothetical protein